MNSKKTLATLGVLFAAIAAEAATALTTPWGEKVTAENAWRDYPRPQMKRANWTCLNGYWDYVVTSNLCLNGRADPQAFEVAKGRILVPFCFESPLSGVGRLIQPNEKMVYTRTVELHPKAGRRILLNFEAVDWRTQVFVNGVEALDVPHEGGNLPFTVDVTDFAHEGENELRVVAWDPTHTFINAGGKQNPKTDGCFYTRVSGIWQTVWMEEVPAEYVRAYRVVTDITAKTVTFEVEGANVLAARAEVLVLDRGRVIAKGVSGKAIKMPDDVRLWTPETPQLYDCVISYGKDVVTGYFAMRKIARKQDAKGVWRFCLNDSFVFPVGTLDQGWWPDGLLTPPSAQACAHDIQTLKDCGFNMMRKHIKVEPRIYYHLCDKMGIMVFQDAPSPAGVCNVNDATKNLQRYGMFRREWKDQIDHLRNHPSIVMWIPYNEAWGQPDAAYTENTLRWTRRYDPTRLVGGPSGWNDYEGGEWVRHDPWKVMRDVYDRESENPSCDTVDQHNYPGPGQCANRRNRISLLGEFGGLGLKIPGHLWDEKAAWGYAGTGDVTDRTANQKHYLELMEKLMPLIADGLGGTVYTQTTDVEVEINGLMTYDRKVLKYDAAVLRETHGKLQKAAADAAK